MPTPYDPTRKSGTNDLHRSDYESAQPDGSVKPGGEAPTVRARQSDFLLRQSPEAFYRWHSLMDRCNLVQWMCQLIEDSGSREFAARLEGVRLGLEAAAKATESAPEFLRVFEYAARIRALIPSAPEVDLHRSDYESAQPDGSVKPDGEALPLMSWTQQRDRISALESALRELLSHPSDDWRDAIDGEGYTLTPLQWAERRARALVRP